MEIVVVDSLQQEMKINLTLKQWLSIGAFIASIVIGFIALFLPPTGVIDSSVLWFVAQLLCFTAGLLGINLNIDNIKQTIKTTKENDKDI